MRTIFPFEIRLARLLMAGAAMMLCGCEDPEREAELRWREEEVNAKEVAMVRREREVLALKQEVDLAKVDLATKEQELAALEKQLREELTAEAAKMKAARIAFENKELRGPTPSVSAERVMVFDPESGEVLYEKNADERGPIASTQKLLTALIIVEDGDLDRMITVTKEDADCAPVRLGIKEGEQYSRRQLLTALMVKSSNDIAQALARDNAGSVEAFVAKMNAKSKELGLEDSMFMNPHGLPSEPMQYSTARDLSVIAALADKLPDVREMVVRKTFDFVREGQSTLTLTNTNRVLSSCSYCDGMKTGYTNASGYCLVASGEKNGKRRIVIVLNDSKYGVWTDAEKLLLWSLKA